MLKSPNISKYLSSCCSASGIHEILQAVMYATTAITQLMFYCYPADELTTQVCFLNAKDSSKNL